MASFPGLLFMVCENTQTEIERPVNKTIATQLVSFPDPLYGPVLTLSPAPPQILSHSRMEIMDSVNTALYYITESIISGP